MDAGQIIDLIPAAIVKGSHPSVSGKALVVGTYMHLTQNVIVRVTTTLQTSIFIASRI